ncbi:hypothetical protein SMD20_39840 [Nonomuraea sp. LP-02]|uniref:hypothetical protein n=1 Tax=Nonomuraea sp. LP-02 TaxID=3097960 RepID=UPI002E31899B|nr:hypothetical protein [Nonomuraea sp. LP-02]MED7930432.1 hypothetical protein [Nonomuraea sp. LP-02]
MPGSPFRPETGPHASSRVLAELARLWDQAAHHEGRRPTQKRLSKESGVPPQTVNSWSTGAFLPREVDQLAQVGAVLARWAQEEPPSVRAWAERLEADRKTSLPWPAAEARAGAGWPLQQVSDPFALEVHHAIDYPPAVLPRLPAYVPRAHDRALRTVAEQAIAGTSQIAVLVGGSSTGKTRACWEVLHLLRGRDQPWRLWHPIAPARPEAILAGLHNIAPYTVVWLNEAQYYLADRERGERVAAELRELLRNPGRAPVLVLATLWPRYWDTLTSPAEPDRHAHARQLLTGSEIPVPAAFTGADRDALASQADKDPRLQEAATRARDGQITQYLAGVPVLMSRYHNAPPEAAAMIAAALEARRLGCGPGLPLAFLIEAAPAYLTETAWEQLDGTRWPTEALEYLTRPCRGIPGILVPVLARPHGRRTGRPGRAAAAPSAGTEFGPLYRLADYLQQHGARHRAADTWPREDVWIAAARHALPGDLGALGRAAQARGLYRHAAQLWKNATRHGDARAADDLVRHVRALPDTGLHAASWAATYAALEDPDAVLDLLESLRTAGAWGAIATLLARDPAGQAVLDHAAHVAGLLITLDHVGARDQVTKLAGRAAAKVALDHLYATAGLLSTLQEVGADPHFTALADRAAAHSPLDDEHALTDLLLELRELGADAPLKVLAGRAAAHVPLDEPSRVAVLLRGLREAGAEAQLAALLRRDPAAHAALDDPRAVEDLLYALRNLQFDDHVALLARPRDLGPIDRHTAVLAARAAAHVPLDRAGSVAELLSRLYYFGADEQIKILLARDPAAHACLDDPSSVADLLGTLASIGEHEHARALAARATSRITVHNPSATARLLTHLHHMGAHEHGITLADLAAAQSPVDDPEAVTRLLESLLELGVDESIKVLLARDPAARVRLDEMSAVFRLLETLQSMGEQEQATRLAARAAVRLDEWQAATTPLSGDPGAPAALALPDIGADLLQSLEDIEDVEDAEANAQACMLADRAAQAAVEDPETALDLMIRLHHLGAREHLHSLAERAAKQAAVDDPDAAARLLRALRELKEYGLVATLVDRLCAAGHFRHALRGDQEDAFMFGREPGGSPAASWRWQDLE